MRSIVKALYLPEESPPEKRAISVKLIARTGEYVIMVQVYVNALMTTLVAIALWLDQISTTVMIGIEIEDRYGIRYVVLVGLCTSLQSLPHYLDSGGGSSGSGSGSATCTSW